MDRTRHLLKSSIIVFVLFGLGKLTGLMRTRLVSTEFGTGPIFDAFTSANQLPEVFVTLISGGALAAAFIPVYTAYLKDRDRQESAKLASTIITLVILVLGGISFIGIFFAPWITANLLVPGYSPEMQALTASLMRIILLQTTLFGISGILSSILNAHQHFALPALAPIALDLGYIVGLLFFVPTLGIFGLAWGTVIGGLLHILIQVPALVRYGFRYLPALAVTMTGVREVIKLMIPRIVTLGSVQVADLAIIRLASNLDAGSTSGYFLGYYIMQLPETLLGTAIAIVVFPTMAEYYNAGDIQNLKRLSMATLRIIWTLTIPAAVALVLLGKPAITLFFEYGAFNEQSTDLVYGILIFFSLRIISEASLEILARLFYAQHNTSTPMFVALAWLVVNISLAYLLVNAIGIRGLALASTIAFTLQSIALFLLNRRHLGYLFERELALSAGRSLLGSAVMALMILVLNAFIENELIFLLTGIILGGISYVIVTFLLGGREIPDLIRLARDKTNQVNAE